MSTGTGLGSLRRRGGLVLVAVLCLSFLWACSASSDGTTKVGDQGDGDSQSSPGQTTAVLSGTAAALVGDWTNADQVEQFCAVGKAIEVGGADQTTTESTLKAGLPCDVDPTWVVVRTIHIDRSGRLVATFTIPDMVDDSGSGVPTTPSASEAALGRCTGLVISTGGGIRFTKPDCDPSSADGVSIGTDGLGETFVNLEGSCLSVDGALFEQKPGGCDEQASSAEEKFSRVGNALENAN